MDPSTGEIHTAACRQRTAELLGRPGPFSDDCIGNDAFAQSAALKAGEVLLAGEPALLQTGRERRRGSAAPARHGNFYVNDAFGPRTVRMPPLAVIASSFPGKKCFGYPMAAEFDNAGRSCTSPPVRIPR